MNLNKPFFPSDNKMVPKMVPKMVSKVVPKFIGPLNVFKVFIKRYL